MEGEVHNLMVDWSVTLASLLYCHGVGIFISQGSRRLLALFPVICLFVYLPLNLNSVFLSGLTSFFISWLACFKLILYAFNHGPLSSSPPLPVSHFISTACLPIKIITNHQTLNQNISKKSLKSPKDYAPRVILLVITIKAYGYKEKLHPLLITSIYAYFIFLALELLLTMAASLVRTLIGVELEPQFDEPHHATSVQDFWGKRWNLMVSSILRPTVYLPARSFFSRLVPQRWVSVPAVFATFLVSGVVHELIFYYMGRFRPTWEVTWFFIVQGVWVGTEIVIKKTIGQWFVPPPIVARVLTLGFIFVTSFWLFFPPLLRLDVFARACREAMALVRFFKDGHLLSPNEFVCPFT